MKKKFRALNWKSFGFVSTMILIGFLYLILGYGAYTFYLEYGLNGLFYFMITICLGMPLLVLFHSYSKIYINDDTLIKQSIFRTKKINLSDYKKVLITKNYPGTIPSVEAVDYKKLSNKWWDNIFVVRHIVLSRHDQFNPYDFRNFKRVTTLPYYNDLFETLREKIKAHHNHN